MWHLRLPIRELNRGTFASKADALTNELFGQLLYELLWVGLMLPVHVDQ